MIHVLPSWPALTAFLAAAVVLAVVPGPGVVYIVTRTVLHGRVAGFASVGGVAIGNAANAAVASLGLAAILAMSSLLFSTLKILGAAYLMLLAVQTLRAPMSSSEAGAIANRSPSKILRDGIVVAALNPKTALFYAAFLPQFLDRSAPATAQAFALSGLFVLVAAVSDSCYVMLAGGIAKALGSRVRTGRLGRYVTAGIYAGLGIFAALTDAKQGLRAKP
jgi:threonine/homoserine/homoserine lactone efflux protein